MPLWASPEVASVKGPPGGRVPPGDGPRGWAGALWSLSAETLWALPWGEAAGSRLVGPFGVGGSPWARVVMATRVRKGWAQGSLRRSCGQLVLAARMQVSGTQEAPPKCLVSRAAVQPTPLSVLLLSAPSVPTFAHPPWSPSSGPGCLHGPHPSTCAPASP